MRELYELFVTAGFSAAHHLCGYGEPCEQVHGHNWKVAVYVQCTQLDALGLGVDFKILRGHLREVLARLDHRDLNATPPFDKLNPSAENLAKWVFERMREKLGPTNAVPVRVTVTENDDSGATFIPE
jgi:6-pyruvoyltetrahydropterin/6-carboxytetrahydropterin synthase